MQKSTDFHFSLDDKVVGVLYLSVFKNVLEAEGFKLKGYSGNLADLNDYRKRLSPKVLYTTLIESLKGVPNGIGFKFGKQLNLVAADSVGQLIMSSTTLMQALKTVQYYHSLLSLSLNFEAKINGPDAIVRFDQLYHRELPLTLQWFASEALLSCCQHQARWLTGEALAFERVCLPYAKPSHSELYDDHLKCDVEFQTPCHELSFKKNVLELPILTANEPVRMIKSQQCQAALKRWERRFSIQARVNTILARTYPAFPSFSMLAQQLHTSRSCLYRKLQTNQTSYQCLINEFKKEKAMSLLRGTALTINEVAEKLGFSDASSFRRAFKGWTGMLPSSIREERRNKNTELFVSSEQTISPQ
mgnify:CR=1 FL=1